MEAFRSVKKLELTCTRNSSPQLSPTRSSLSPLFRTTDGAEEVIAVREMKGLGGLAKMVQEGFFSPSADMTVMSMFEGSGLLVDIRKHESSHF